jgi:uncharacterized membrane protein YhaH (DUF805 family)
MIFWQAIQSGFSHYVKFSGRAAPSEFWYWVLFTFLGTAATAIVDLALFPSLTSALPLCDLVTLATLLPSLAVSTRRLHDTGRRGWWVLLLLVPLGVFLLIVWWVEQGTAGGNKYGADPSREATAASPRPAA